MECNKCTDLVKTVWFKLFVLLLEVAFSIWAIILWWPCLRDEIVTAVGDPVRCTANALNFVVVIQLLLATGLFHVLLAFLVIIGFAKKPQEGSEKWKMLSETLILSQILDFAFDIGTVICFGVVYGTLDGGVSRFTSSMWLFMASNVVSGCFSLYMIYSVVKSGLGRKDFRFSYFCCGGCLFWLPWKDEDESKVASAEETV